MSRQLPHNERYVLAEEFMEVVYKLWEGSWEDDAVLRDKANRIFARPEKIHKVHHQGAISRWRAIIFANRHRRELQSCFKQAPLPGARRFAAQHAECVFISGRNPKLAAEIVSDLRERARMLGRDPESLVIFTALTSICGKTDAEAQAKLEDYRKHVATEGTLALLSGYLGIDFASSNLDEPLNSREINAIQSCVDGFIRFDPTRTWSLRDAVERLGVAGYKPLLVGSPSTVADGLIGWMEESDVDGFNIEYIVSPGDFAAFVDLVVPELHRRGVHKTSYKEGTLREKLYGKGQRHVPASHPAANYRFRRI